MPNLIDRVIGLGSQVMIWGVVVLVAFMVSLTDKEGINMV